MRKKTIWTMFFAMLFTTATMAKSWEWENHEQSWQPFHAEQWEQLPTSKTYRVPNSVKSESYMSYIHEGYHWGPKSHSVAYKVNVSVPAQRHPASYDKKNFYAPQYKWVLPHYHYKY